MDWQGIPITDGTGQGDRMPAAFAPDYFNVDELSFAQLLAMGSEIAAQIKYYNLGNQQDGDWSALFDADEAVILSTILSIDLTRLTLQFRAIPDDRPADLVNYVLALAARIDFWLQRLSARQHRSAELFAQKIKTLISDKLAPELHNLGWIVDRTDIKPTLSFAEFSGAWGVGDPESEDPYPRSTLDILPQMADIKHRLGASFNTIANSITYLQTTAADCLQQSLKSEQHDPAIGLFVVFLQLFKKSRDRLNRFTSRHLDFYYRQILGAANRLQTPECFYLLLETRRGVEKLPIEKGAAFSAGKDEDLSDIVFRADEGLLASDASIEMLATLNFQYDTLISPEADIGYVTRIKSARPLPESFSHAGGALPADATAWPLFGAGQPGHPDTGSADARMGFAIASPLLLLEQGRRRIEITVELQATQSVALESRLKSLRQCATAQQFRQHFTGLFALYLLRFKGDLSQPQKAELIDTAEKLLPADQANEIRTLLQQDWQGLFYRLFKHPFRYSLTSESGWVPVHDTLLLPCGEEESAGLTGFRILLNLDQTQPPISGYRADVHGDQLATGLPVLRCELDQQAHFCVYSVFQNLCIDALQIDVEVSGVKDLQIYNQNGQLDPGKPFQPFGPLPGTGSYLVFGNHEMARKPLRELEVQLDWSELPTAAGGFDEHYGQYPSALNNNSFVVAFSTLADGSWKPVEPAAQPQFSLFESIEPGNAVASQTTIAIDRLNHAREIDFAIDAADFRFGLKARGGFYRLSLVQPDNGFGHGDYPRLLASVLTANARKKQPDPLPNPPYTPTLKGISLSYRAVSRIRPAEEGSAAERIYHLHPFGVERVYPPLAEQRCCLLPQYEHEGHLFIGLSASDIAGPLSLLFHLAQDTADPERAGNARFEWLYLAADRWLRLPANRILADDTHGFLASGRLTIDIPRDISAENSVMPPGYYWLRLAVDRSAGAFPACYFVKPHAIKVSRQQRGLSQVADRNQSLGKNNWRPLQTLPDIIRVAPAWSAFGGRRAEDDGEFRRRVSERLRHKNRALLPRDYELLALEQFPELLKVKCFNSLSHRQTTAKPGHVLVVVVPRVDDTGGGACRRACVDARKLQQIGEFLGRRCPTFVSLEVINPVYEQIQVRCSVKFADALSEGINLKQLNQQIGDYLCPWHAPGYEARFGWSIRQRDIESYILGLGYIDYVTNFSMLHITVDSDGRYSLRDTARDEQRREAVIRPRYPWSLAIPMQDHFIATTRETTSIRAGITGVDELEIGSTFIIGNSDNGEKK